MIYGWTGTRFGMTEKQDARAHNLLYAADMKELHHGDCVGADAEAHAIVLPQASCGDCRIVIHPPVDEKHRAFCKDKEICVCTHNPTRHLEGSGRCHGNGGNCLCEHYERRTDQVIWLPPKTYFARNRDIVDVCDILLATPYHQYEEAQGGTWYTINYARKRGKWLVIVWPDGSLQVENTPRDLL